MFVFLEGISKTKILVIGDLMLDPYIFGDAEAPVPVVDVEEERERETKCTKYGFWI
jgi:bifunctional ADP-heptose synthase (sugar kinase/adenylyltransferase)